MQHSLFYLCDFLLVPRATPRTRRWSAWAASRRAPSSPLTTGLRSALSPRARAAGPPGSYVCPFPIEFSLEMVENLNALALLHLSLAEFFWAPRVSVNIHVSAFSVDVEGSDDGPGEAKKRKVAEKESEENGVGQSAKGYTITFSSLYYEWTQLSWVVSKWPRAC